MHGLTTACNSAEKRRVLRSWVDGHLSLLEPEDVAFAKLYYRSPLPGEMLHSLNYGNNAHVAGVSNNVTDSTFLHSTVTANVTKHYMGQ